MARRVWPVHVVLTCCAWAVAGCASNGDTDGTERTASARPGIVAGEAIGGARLGATEQALRRALGHPDAIRRQSISETGDPIWQWKYRRRRLTIDLHEEDGRRQVLAVATKSSRYRTAEGLRVGSAGADIRHEGFDCGAGDPGEVWCTETAGDRQTIIVLERDRATAVRVTKIY